MNYQRLNNIFGWLMFLVAAGVYLATVEPTASYWDCGEFIAVSDNLMVPHPPGAPFFLLLGRLFAMFAPTDLDVAYYINLLSVFASAFTILFMFWTITRVSRKLLKIGDDEEPGLGHSIAIMGAGIVGALSFTFSDSFWFSAVEAEVYALSSFFTAFVFWAMLKWDARADNAGSDRWLILIAYMVGLSIGVHLLNLLAIPALGFIYYFRRYKPNMTGGIITFLTCSVILGVILIFIIPGLPSISWSFEYIFVNVFGLGFGSGVIFFSIIFIAAVVFGLLFSIRKNMRILNVIMLSLVFILIGYSCYGLIIIRSNFDPTIDENDPEEVNSFVSYLKREQYGDRPLLFGPQFTAKQIKTEKGDPMYKRGEDKYVRYNHKIEPVYDPEHQTLFPRMHRKDHAGWYRDFLANRGSYRQGEMPSQGDNIAYFMQQQVGYMYFRYFGWNFIGRAGDEYGSEVISPAAPDDVPYWKSSKARNNFFALPFILGILGIAFNFIKDKKMMLILGTLFFFTGIAIIIYLNAPPVEPRERDYAYAGSYYVFAIWIGLGVLFFYELLNTYLLKNKKIAGVLATVICLGVPTIMAAEGWDDHDRSGRYFSVDSARNLLSTCEENAIIFTGGDNDTFPLWYVQEVEKFRRDVRVCNLSLLNTDWYIDQMKRQAYESAPLPISLENDQYIQGTNDIVFYNNPKNEDPPMKLNVYMSLVEKAEPSVRYFGSDDPLQVVLPSRRFVLNVDTDKVKGMDAIPQKYKRTVKPRMEWSLGKVNYIDKKDLIILNMLANINENGWERPVYFSTTLGSSNYLNLKPFMFLEGLAFRLTPANHGQPEGAVNTERMTKNLMEKYSWRGLDNPDIFYDENYKRFTLNSRLQFFRLAQEYLQRENNKEMARKVIDECLTVMPNDVIPYDIYTSQFIPILFELGETEKAKKLASTMAKDAYELFKYNSEQDKHSEQDLFTSFTTIRVVTQAYRQYVGEEAAKPYENQKKEIEAVFARLQQRKESKRFMRGR